MEILHIFPWNWSGCHCYSKFVQNIDKTMFQEAAGTATLLKQGCPSSKYYVLAEYLDMEPENPRLTDIDKCFFVKAYKEASR
ncbi:Bpu10I family restriction endonuclease [Candidatus Poribacteria bacterium]|nr:Bpu10I family restriction endonuclease [Candidatus Poribacteria bacterium]